MSVALWSGILGGLALLGVSSAAHSAEIDHKALGCVVAEKYPRLEARVTPPDGVSRARVFFRAEGRPAWYAVAMKRDGDIYAAVLPKPKKSLKRFEYYLEVMDTAMTPSRTQDYRTDVVSGAGGCGSGMMAVVVSAASVLLEVPAGAAAIPAGFSSAGVVAAGSTAAGAATAATGAASGGGGGVGTTALIVGGAAVVAGAAVAASTLGGSGDDDASGFVIEGNVYNDSTFNPGETAAGQLPINMARAVQGAVISTSLDSATASSDAAGHFRLVTQTPMNQCESNGPVFSVTVAAAGCSPLTTTKQWGCGDPQNPGRRGPGVMHVLNLRCP
jgi:hypothetical protein